MLYNKSGHHKEKPTHHNEEYPQVAATRERPHKATKTQNRHKLIYKNEVKENKGSRLGKYTSD